MKNNILAMLLISMISMISLTVLVSCSEEPVSDTVETTVPGAEETGADTDAEPELPDSDFLGESFMFLLRLSNQAYDEIYVYTEEYDGEVVNDAIYDRNRAVEEKYNIDIEATFIDQVSQNAQKTIMANDDSFEVMWDCKNAMPSLITNGYLVNFNTVPYLNLDAAYWDKNASEQLSVLNKLYFMPSDISMQNFTGARFLYFNKKLVEDYTLDDPYERIKSNNWTLDVVLNMIKSVSEDLNGDGIMDSNDRYGILSENGAANANILYFIKSAGIRNTTNDSDGVPQLSCMNEKLIKIAEMCKEVFDDKNVAITYEEASKGASIGDFPHIFAYCRGSLFTTDHFLFVQNGVEETVSFKDMESDYGIAPNPKFDQAQEEYSHRIDPYTTIMAIPITNTDPERTGIILEYMSWMSSKTVLPAYYETTIKTKRTRDNEAPLIVDMIKASISYEISDIFDLGITSMLWEGYASGNISSTYAKREAAIQTKLDKLVEDMRNIGV
jgi:ABC-type glycerol-3-phosphate transport system substrate-binding protein